MYMANSPMRKVKRFWCCILQSTPSMSLNTPSFTLTLILSFSSAKSLSMMTKSSVEFSQNHMKLCISSSGTTWYSLLLRCSMGNPSFAMAGWRRMLFRLSALVRTKRYFVVRGRRVSLFAPLRRVLCSGQKICMSPWVARCSYSSLHLLDIMTYQLCMGMRTGMVKV